ncbi:hypothetical protein M0R45_016274 [Rubus argutus]|uniref:Zinc knuckle CX2CX4HX4C domain-containing protein n=1 Tax=Rubus argutus TaxID=59490 RepID=A0AAW1XUJ5_RUBAR
MGVRMPGKLDPKTANRSIGLYARVLIDVDFSRPLIDQLQVSWVQGDSVIVGVEYETKPDLCDVCGIVGHKASNCKSATTIDPVPSTRGRSKVCSHRHVS